MTLHELLTSLHVQLNEAGVSPSGSTADLAFVARRDRDGEVEIDFVDAAAMSKPRPEQLHRLKLSLADLEDSPFEIVKEKKGESAKSLESGLFKKGEALDSPPAFRHTAKPPSLPPPRGQ